jgi:ketosteroid isomerase-like protein
MVDCAEIMRILPTFLVAALVLPACATAPTVDPAEVTAVMDAFYGAMKKGDPMAAMSLIAPGAMFVESGKLETRAEYESNHLPSDIEFEAQVTGKRRVVQVHIEGDAAWLIAETAYVGSFNGNDVDFVSSQLMVLTRQAGRWMIRTVHWSSRPNLG